MASILLAVHCSTQLLQNIAPNKIEKKPGIRLVLSNVREDEIM